MAVGAPLAGAYIGYKMGKGGGLHADKMKNFDLSGKGKK